MISVIITSYNFVDFLPECINSVLSQKHQDFEIIIVDDGSTDVKTVDYLNSLNNPKINIQLKKNEGVSIARNFGAALSKGEYLIFLDGDDKLHENYFLQAIQAFENNKTLNYIFSDLYEFGERDNKVYFEDIKIKNLLLYCGSHVSAIITKSLWLKSNGFSTDFKEGWEDWDFLIRLHSAGLNAHKLIEPLFYYRIRKNSRTEISHLYHNKKLEQLLFKNNMDAYLYHFDEPITILREYENQKYQILQLQQKVDNIYNTKSYKLGHLLLSPFKFIKNKF